MVPPYILFSFVLAEIFKWLGEIWVILSVAKCLWLFEVIVSSQK